MSSRASGYTHAEDILMCQVNIEISQDPIVGTQQPGYNFWKRVEKSYNELKIADWEYRTDRSLQSRITKITRAGKKFKGCIRQVEARRISGASTDDIMKQTKVLFAQDPNYKSGWKFEHVWDVIKDSEKFKDCDRSSKPPTKKRVSSESDNPTPDSPASHSFSSFQMNLGDDDIDDSLNRDFGGFSSSRPIGVKKAKSKAKKGESSSTFLSSLEENSKKAVEFLETSSAQLATLCDLKTMKEENKMLAIDLDSIKTNPRYHAYVKVEQDRIYAKRTQQHGDGDSDATATYRPYYNYLSGSSSDLPPF